MEYIFGKMNEHVLDKGTRQYTGLTTSTTETIVDNRSDTIAVHIKNLNFTTEALPEEEVKVIEVDRRRQPVEGNYAYITFEKGCTHPHPILDFGGERWELIRNPARYSDRAEHSRLGEIPVMYRAFIKFESGNKAVWVNAPVRPLMVDLDTVGFDLQSVIEGRESIIELNDNLKLLAYELQDKIAQQGGVFVVSKTFHILVKLTSYSEDRNVFKMEGNDGVVQYTFRVDYRQNKCSFGLIRQDKIKVVYVDTIGVGNYVSSASSNEIKRFVDSGGDVELDYEDSVYVYDGYENSTAYFKIINVEKKSISKKIAEVSYDSKVKFSEIRTSIVDGFGLSETDVMSQAAVTGEVEKHFANKDSFEKNYGDPSKEGTKIHASQAEIYGIASLQFGIDSEYALDETKTRMYTADEYGRVFTGSEKAVNKKGSPLQISWFKADESGVVTLKGWEDTIAYSDAEFHTGLAVRHTDDSDMSGETNLSNDIQISALTELGSTIDELKNSFGGLATIEYVDAKAEELKKDINTRATVEYVDQQLSLKDDITSVDAKLEKKADITLVDEKLTDYKTKANYDAVYNERRREILIKDGVSSFFISGTGSAIFDATAKYVNLSFGVIYQNSTIKVINADKRQVRVKVNATEVIDTNSDRKEYVTNNHLVLVSVLDRKEVGYHDFLELDFITMDLQPMALSNAVSSWDGHDDVVLWETTAFVAFPNSNMKFKIDGAHPAFYNLMYGTIGSNAHITTEGTIKVIVNGKTVQMPYTNTTGCPLNYQCGYRFADGFYMYFTQESVFSNSTITDDFDPSAQKQYIAPKEAKLTLDLAKSRKDPMITFDNTSGIGITLTSTDPNRVAEVRILGDDEPKKLPFDLDKGAYKTVGIMLVGGVRTLVLESGMSPSNEYGNSRNGTYSQNYINDNFADSDTVKNLDGRVDSLENDAFSEWEYNFGDVSSYVDSGNSDVTRVNRMEFDSIKSPNIIDPRKIMKSDTDGSLTITYDEESDTFTFNGTATRGGRYMESDVVWMHLGPYGNLPPLRLEYIGGSSGYSHEQSKYAAVIMSYSDSAYGEENGEITSVPLTEEDSHGAIDYSKWSRKMYFKIDSGVSFDNYSVRIFTNEKDYNKNYYPYVRYSNRMLNSIVDSVKVISPNMFDSNDVVDGTINEYGNIINSPDGHQVSVTKMSSISRPDDPEGGLIVQSNNTNSPIKVHIWYDPSYGGSYEYYGSKIVNSGEPFSIWMTQVFAIESDERGFNRENSPKVMVVNGKKPAPFMGYGEVLNEIKIDPHIVNMTNYGKIGTALDVKNGVFEDASVTEIIDTSKIKKVPGTTDYTYDLTYDISNRRWSLPHIEAELTDFNGVNGYRKLIWKNTGTEDEELFRKVFEGGLEISYRKAGNPSYTDVFKYISEGIEVSTGVNGLPRIEFTKYPVSLQKVSNVSMHRRKPLEILQETGKRDDAVMSQKAVTDELNKKFDSANLVDTTGTSKTMAMTQDSITKLIEALQTDTVKKANKTVIVKLI